MKRRIFLKHTSMGLLALGMGSTYAKAKSITGRHTSIVRPISSGEKQCWFGYYDKWQIDPSGRYALGAKVDTFFRSPSSQDVLQIGLIDLQQNNTWKEIGRSTSWGWQQGCMLQWIPGSAGEVIWNDQGEKGFVSRIYNTTTGKTRTLPRAVYTLSPDGAFALCVDFDRLQFFRPGYGYPTKQAVDHRSKAPNNQGIYKLDLKSGESKLLISYEQIARLERQIGTVGNYYHWFNHLLINPSGTRFIFLNRSRPVASHDEMTVFRKENPDFKRTNFSGHYVTRAITANLDGTNLYALNDSGMFSHFIWKGDERICAWAVPEDKNKAAFYDFRDQSKTYSIVGEGIMTQNGHNTYVPHTNYEWILNDTYPIGPERMQELYLFHIPSKRKVSLGKFHEPEKFSGEWRCDLHPRCNQQGTEVFFDSTHDGSKRQMYAVDIAEIISK